MTVPRLRGLLRTTVTLSCDDGSTWTTVTTSDRRVILDGRDPDEHIRSGTAAALLPEPTETPWWQRKKGGHDGV